MTSIKQELCRSDIHKSSDYVILLAIFQLLTELTTGYRRDVNIVNVDGDIVDGGCNGEVLSDGVGREN